MDLTGSAQMGDASVQGTRASSAGTAFATGSGEGVFPLNGRLDRDDFDRLLTWAARNKASDITIQPGSPVRAEIGGRWRSITSRTLTAPDIETAARAIYGDNARAEIGAGHDLDPSYDIMAPALSPEEEDTCNYSLDDPAGLGRVRFRVNITPGRVPGGVSAQLTIRTLPSQPIPLSKLNLEQEITEHFRPYQGLNLICGPTGSGKSTLMSSLVRWRLETPGANEKIITFEKPIEYTFDGISSPDSFVWQTDLGNMLRPREGRDEHTIWAYAIRNALRRKPSMIVLGEMRDRPTIEAGIEGALTGHLLLSTLHTIGVPETMRRLVMPFDPSERRTIAVDLLQVLNLIVTQLLVDRIGGGKVAVREFMLFDAKVRRALEDISVDEWPSHIRKMLSEKRVTGQSMAQAAAILHQEGKITLEVRKHLEIREASE